MRALSTVWVAAVLLLGASAAQADVFVYTFTGTLSGGQTDYTGLFGPATLTTGEAYTTTFVLNTSLGTFANGPTDFEYTNGAIVSSTLTIGTGNPVVSFDPPNGSSSYADYNTFYPPGTYEFHSATSASSATGLSDYLDQTFQGTQPFPLTTTGIYPLTAGNGNFGIETAAGNIALGLIPTSLTVSEVPLPASAWLMLSALGAFGCLARKRRNPSPAASI